jgi:hypothetical protein
MKATTGPPTQYGRFKSRDPCKNSEDGNSKDEAAAAETIGTSQRQQQKGDPQQHCLEICLKVIRKAKNS